MRFSVTLAFLGMFMASNVLATPEALDSRSVSIDARNVFDPYTDVEERDLFDIDLKEFDAREYFNQELSERTAFQDLLDYVTREVEDEGALEARYDFDELDERQFIDDEAEFTRRMVNLAGIKFDAREPLRYRIGVVVQSHNA